MKDSIHIIKVYEELNFDSPDRNIGWFDTAEKAVQGLHNFGSECRWSYAVIEELHPGIHPWQVSAKWFKFNDVENDWEPLELNWDNSFMTCVNHTIG